MMGCLYNLLLVLCVVLSLGELVFCADKYCRNDFPSDFVFGAGSSAYQVEGAALEDGRTPSIWDTFAHAGYAGGGNGDIACDEYHKYKEDVRLMVETGLEAYRFSISWSRLIPDGRGNVNQKAVLYYNNLIDELILHGRGRIFIGIEPHVTLVHSDLPQILEDEYEGMLSRLVVNDFVAYAEVCFALFGDRVLYWTTFNEVNVFCIGGYDHGFTPPSRCSPHFGNNCNNGNSSNEPYLAAHNILLAHAAAARLYKLKYQGKQGGVIGINLFSYWYIPYTNATEDVIATQRANDFYIGWERIMEHKAKHKYEHKSSQPPISSRSTVKNLCFTMFLDPLVFGKYPEIMKKNAGRRMPDFTEEESKQIKGSFDFIGINHYSTVHIKDRPSSLDINTRDFDEDSSIEMIDAPIDTKAAEFPITPSGLQGVLEYIKQFYGNPPVYIHENGQQTRRNSTLNDTTRVEYLQAYIGSLLDAIRRNGSNTRGYFTWSFLDLFELLGGYNSAFGLYYIDLDDKDLKRYPKLSAHWYSSFLKGKSIILNGSIARSENISKSFQPHLSQ